MIIIIPLGGLGERFRKWGYRRPKPLINVMGKPILFWLLDNLTFDSIEMVIIPYNSELDKYNFESLLIKNYPKINFKFLKLNILTQGAAETILLGLELIDSINLPDCPVLCMDGDNFYTHNIIKQWKGENNVFYFNDCSDSNAYSFLKMDSGNIIIDIMEKNRISDHASTGCYGFKSYHKLKLYCQQLINADIRQKNEFYISGVVKLMIEENHIFTGKNINRNDYHCLGTPFDVRLFCNNYDKNKISDINMRYCFDLDNTLVTYPKISGDYSTVEPIQDNIDLLRYLKKNGNTIIIYTARRMCTHNGCIGKVTADIGKLTLDTLDKFNIPYDEIYFGKPYADYYIDDSAVSPYDDLEKELGFYRSTIDTRTFNNITENVVHTYTKYGRDLSGEIYWYQNIPQSIKDMFPIFFNAGENCYVMEKINGIPFSRLMLSGEMSIENLEHIMDAVDKIHVVPIDETDINSNINIYENYHKKLVERYSNYNYSKFKRSKDVFNILEKTLIEYEEKKLGVTSVIHGDTVLTNIMINQFGKIKFIDMRGKIGSTITILGDKFYDWAKLYQSLIGYDEILENKHVSESYRKTLLEFFNNRFIHKYGNSQFNYLQYLTASLLFTLIPLHDNEKCDAYYNLIFKIISL